MMADVKTTTTTTTMTTATTTMTTATMTTTTRAKMRRSSVEMFFLEMHKLLNKGLNLEPLHTNKLYMSGFDDVTGCDRSYKPLQ